MAARLKHLSKFLTLMLRHKADSFGVVLDAEGFADLDAVWAVVQARLGQNYTRAHLDALLSDSVTAQRFEIHDGKIRARYGHSEDVRAVVYPPAEPPALLYHGTYVDAFKAILAEGIHAQSRQYVHLSTSVEHVLRVAERHGKPIVLQVSAARMHAAGFVFYQPEPLVYLTKTVPPEYLTLLA